MPPVFNPRMANDPTGDPALFVPFFYEKRALIFDAGEISTLSPRDILKISHVFITHTHMDHFIGFDRILRICLGREKTLHVFGPEGFIQKVSSKLGAYTWNLVHNYENPLVMRVTETRPDRLVSCRFDCRNRFEASRPEYEAFPFPVLYHEPGFTVEAAILDHDTACLGFALKERLSINIRKEALDEMGLIPGPWLYELKQALYADMNPETRFEIPDSFCRDSGPVEFRLCELSDRLAILTRGKKIAYITDAAFNRQNVEKIMQLAQNADHLFIEAAFLEKDKDIAARKKHLTAAQAGRIAAEAGAKRYTLFHFSPRYSGCYEELEKEAAESFRLNEPLLRQTLPGA
ncbi:MAG: ribonuclease Z [Desulfobacteraceae bacterium]|nr:ribonuclease Z [Desulfobacteraceae bacterium]